MTKNDMQYIIEDNGKETLVKDLPLNQICYTEGFDGSADYNIFLLTEKSLCVALACEKEDGTIYFHENLKDDYEWACSVKKDNLLNVSLSDAYSGIVSFTLYPYENEEFPGTDKENGFIEHTIYNGDISSVIKLLDDSVDIIDEGKNEKSSIIKTVEENKNKIAKADYEQPAKEKKNKINIE